MKSIEDIKPNYYLKFGFLAEIIGEIVGDSAVILLCDETKTLNIDIYNYGQSQLNITLKDSPFLRNLALQLLLELTVPFDLEDKTIFENYSLFVVAWGCMKLNLIAVSTTEKGINFRTHGQVFTYTGEERLVGLSALISRGICQSPEKSKRILDRLNDNKFTTPAYLALLVK